MRKVLMVMLAMLFAVQLGFAQTGCPDVGCYNHLCYTHNGTEEGWIMVHAVGQANTFGGAQIAKCYLDCFFNQCRTDIAANQNCDSPDNIGTIAHMDPLGQGILRIRDIRRGDFEKYAKKLDKLGSKITFSYLQEAVQKSHLAFAKNDMQVYTMAEYTKLMEDENAYYASKGIQTRAMVGGK